MFTAISVIARAARTRQAVVARDRDNPATMTTITSISKTRTKVKAATGLLDEGRTPAVAKPHSELSVVETSKASDKADAALKTTRRR